MDLKKKIPKNMFNSKFLKTAYKFIDTNYTNSNILLFFLVIYISIVSIYTPRIVIAFVNNSIVKMLILTSIILLGRKDVILGLFLAIALLITINLDNTISLIEKEHFKDNVPVIDEKPPKKYNKVSINMSLPDKFDEGHQNLSCTTVSKCLNEDFALTNYAYCCPEGKQSTNPVCRKTPVWAPSKGRTIVTGSKPEYDDDSDDDDDDDDDDDENRTISGSQSTRTRGSSNKNKQIIVDEEE